MLSDRLLLPLFRRFPPGETIFIQPDGRAEAEYASETEWPFYWWFGRPDLFLGKTVLDLGCGYGGRPVRFLGHGSEAVVGVEISDRIVQEAGAFAGRSGVEDRVTFRVGTGEQIPAADSEFDLITMFDVMEHVVAPRDVLAECFRVLRPGGKLAVVFPPYYALRGGPHLHGYVTWLPGLNLIFTTRALRSAAAKRLAEQGIDYEPYFREVPSDRLWNMNGLTARHFRRLVARTGFQWEIRRHTSHFEFRRRKGTMPTVIAPVYWSFRILANVPALRELFCERVVALLRRPG